MKKIPFLKIAMVVSVTLAVCKAFGTISIGWLWIFMPTIVCLILGGIGLFLGLAIMVLAIFSRVYGSNAMEHMDQCLRDFKTLLRDSKK
ncbi:MAG: hypothetical protein ACRDD8_11685 [Bacteroidales bacterium]